MKRSLAVLMLTGLALLTTGFCAAAAPAPAAPPPPVPGIRFPRAAPVAASPAVPAPAAPELSVPPNLQHVVTAAEFHTYIEFQQQLRNDEAIRELNDRILVHVQELQKLQLQLNALRDKALARNPAAKAIGDRIQQALSPQGPSAPSTN